MQSENHFRDQQSPLKGENMDDQLSGASGGGSNLLLDYVAGASWGAKDAFNTQDENSLATFKVSESQDRLAEEQEKEVELINDILKRIANKTA